jgi:hypothetical protein
MAQACRRVVHSSPKPDVKMSKALDDAVIVVVAFFSVGMNECDWGLTAIAESTT